VICVYRPSNRQPGVDMSVRIRFGRHFGAAVANAREVVLDAPVAKVAVRAEGAAGNVG
jgi:hypothetical protein